MGTYEKGFYEKLDKVSARLLRAYRQIEGNSLAENSNRLDVILTLLDEIEREIELLVRGGSFDGKSI